MLRVTMVIMMMMMIMSSAVVEGVDVVGVAGGRQLLVAVLVCIQPRAARRLRLHRPSWGTCLRAKLSTLWQSRSLDP